MLILTRRIGEAVVIGGEISVRIMKVKGNQVVLGIDCPKEIPVHREEIQRRIINEQLNRLLSEQEVRDVAFG